VVCDEDEWGKRLLREIPGLRAAPVGEAFDSPLVGDFNRQNLAVAAELARGLGVPEAALAEGLRRARVPGRLEPVADPRGRRVFVDYAHKPGALEKVLMTLRPLREGHSLITVFGCGGDRDRGKRPVMGKLAAAFSDHVIVTSDNPRTEDPAAIIAEVLAGISGKGGPPSHVEIEPDRREAIRKALARARAGDIVLIAGKGHEDYQIVGDRKQPFDDRLVARELLRDGASEGARASGSDKK
jgi:UDP-N-acetylmuramoyl-L-alanyl-D-glutamate--2,6-diaminopimelate ligase